MIHKGFDKPNSWLACAKALNEVGSAGVLAVLLAFLVYHVIYEVVPHLRAIPRIEAAAEEQARRSSEMVRVLRLQCRALMTLSKADPDKCGEIP